mmetsp:Transcript_58609/g.178743  ORF Transcript_58609/g.178743 Transcript_58609/m.178743 type:complete len:457 (-) Transcript_58609:203-1573(-)
MLNWNRAMASFPHARRNPSIHRLDAPVSALRAYGKQNSGKSAARTRRCTSESGDPCMSCKGLGTLNLDVTQHLPLLSVTTVSSLYPTHRGGQVLVLLEGLGNSRTCCSNRRFVGKARRCGFGVSTASAWSAGHSDRTTRRSLGQSNAWTTSIGSKEIALSVARNAMGRQNFGASACAASVTQLNVSNALLRDSTSSCRPHKRLVNFRFSARNRVGVNSSTHKARARHTVGHSCKAKRCKAYKRRLSSVTRTPCSLRCSRRMGGKGGSIRRTVASLSGARSRICNMTSEMGPRPWKKGWILPCEKRTSSGQTQRSSQTIPSSCTFRMVSSGKRSGASACGPQGKLPKAACTAFVRSPFSFGGDPTGPSPSPPLPFHSAPHCLPFPSQPSDQPFHDDHSHHLSLLDHQSPDSQPSCWSLAASLLPRPLSFAVPLPTAASCAAVFPLPLPFPSTCEAAG